MPIIPLAQVASFSGVWGLTFLVVLGNMLVWELVVSYIINRNQSQKWLHLLHFYSFYYYSRFC